ncbi:TPA: ATP-binding protein [Serratia fonticola]|nr:ATP-binding protein [Serratia fonticola]
MDNVLDDMPLWKRTLGCKDNGNQNIEFLRIAFLEMRSNVEKLVKDINAELPGLTVHDITHLDALWRVANEIIGDEYPINPAEAFVLGGAFLLHDAAHVLIAYPEGLKSIKKTILWNDLVYQKHNGKEPLANSIEEKDLIFKIIRQLHSRQAHELLSMSWKVSEGQELFILSNPELRNYYADLIGEVAESHHWTPQKVSEEFRDKLLAPPGFFKNREWTVDALKVALILRTADAAHLDSSRAPLFLFALKNPQGLSKNHWVFQSKMGQVFRDKKGQLRLSSGSKFNSSERDSWWLAYDTAKMIDFELRSANSILREEKREIFSTNSVLGVTSPEAFSKYVAVKGWLPIDINPKISNTQKLIELLGGSALYGDNKYIVIRELVQNGSDAVRALRSFEYLDPEEGSVEIHLEKIEDKQWWLHITDSGIGMSKYVITDVLLDFGNSLWGSDGVMDELPGLAKTGFTSCGKFGIGFYSVFMLTKKVKIITNRYKKSPNDINQQWKLEFENGLASRPVLTTPLESEQLKKNGTKISLLLSDYDLVDIVNSAEKNRAENLFPTVSFFNSDSTLNNDVVEIKFEKLIKMIFPTSDVDLKLKINNGNSKETIKANDWKSIGNEDILRRVNVFDGEVFELKNELGELIGRVGVEKNTYSAHGITPMVVTHKGISAGILTGFIGVCLSSGNNANAIRDDASPQGTLIEWKNWANNVITDSKNLTQDQLLTIHPIVPDRDLRIWKMGGMYLTLSEIKVKLSELDEFYTHSGTIDFEFDDDVREDNFRDFFNLKENVIISPYSGWGGYLSSGTPKELMKKFNLSAINYRSVLYRFIESSFPDKYIVEEDCADVVVGTVCGVDIIRFVERYTKK